MARRLIGIDITRADGSVEPGHDEGEGTAYHDIVVNRAPMVRLTNGTIDQQHD
jgi:hypothetical protein